LTSGNEVKITSKIKRFIPRLEELYVPAGVVFFDPRRFGRGLEQAEEVPPFWRWLAWCEAARRLYRSVL
jgi:hypothetical protein